MRHGVSPDEARARGAEDGATGSTFTGEGGGNRRLNLFEAVVVLRVLFLS